MTKSNNKSKRRAEKYKSRTYVVDANRRNRKEKHEKLHPNDKGVVNNPSGICKCCQKHISELRKNPTLMHFSVEELGKDNRRFKGKPTK